MRATGGIGIAKGKRQKEGERERQQMVIGGPLKGSCDVQPRSLGLRSVIQRVPNRKIKKTRKEFPEAVLPVNGCDRRA